MKIFFFIFGGLVCFRSFRLFAIAWFITHCFRSRAFFATTPIVFGGVFGGVFRRYVFRFLVLRVVGEHAFQIAESHVFFLRYAGENVEEVCGDVLASFRCGVDLATGFLRGFLLVGGGVGPLRFP